MISLIIFSVLVISSKSHLLALISLVYRYPTSITYEPIFSSIFLYQQPWETGRDWSKDGKALGWGSFFYLIHKSSIKQINC